MNDGRGGAALGRRAFVLGGAASLGLVGEGGWSAAVATTRPVENYRDFDSPALPMPMMLGTQHPMPSESQTARRLLDAAPKTSPLAIMLYFESLKAVNKDREAYNGGWQERWNPVIVDFFRETATTPAGDTTSWCAAFLNWSLARAGYRGGTGSASSGSFRTVLGLTDRPRPGDIAVFGSADPAQFEAGRGHVGLFIKERDDALLVLGGNQKNPYGHHTVCRKWLDKDGGELKLHSFHRIRALRTRSA